MTDDRSLERAARSWLEEGPTVAPDRPVEEALARIQTTPQERGPLVPWRLPTMNPAMKIAGVAVLAVAAIAGSLYLLGGNGGGIGTQPTPSPSDTPSATVAPTPDPTPTPIDASTWTTYVSDTYQFSIQHPADWTVRPSTHVWTLEVDGGEFGGTENNAGEIFNSADGRIGISAWSVTVEPGTTLEEWVAAYCEMNTTPCAAIRTGGSRSWRKVGTRTRASSCRSLTTSRCSSRPGTTTRGRVRSGRNPHPPTVGSTPPPAGALDLVTTPGN